MALFNVDEKLNAKLRSRYRIFGFYHSCNFIIKICHLTWSERWVMWLKFTVKLSGASKASVTTNNILGRKLELPHPHMLKSIDLLIRTSY